MRKSIIINYRPIISRAWNEYNGDKTFDQFVRQEKKNIIQKVCSFLNKVELPFDYSFKVGEFSVKDREITIYYEWEEKENIHDWNNRVADNVQALDNHIWSNGLTCITKNH